MLQVQKRKSRSIVRVERNDDSLFMYSEYGILKVSPQNEWIMRITFTCVEYFSKDTGMGITYDQPYADWSYYEANGFVFLQTSGVTLEISKAQGSIRYFDQKDTLLLSERSYESRVLEEFDAFKPIIDENTQVELVETPDGIKRIIKETNRVFDKKLYHTRLFLDWQKDEALFGLGQAEEGTFNLRGTTQYMHQANLKIAIPFLLSTKGYGVLLATGSPVIFNDTEYGSYLYTEADPQMDFYFIAGDCFDKIIKGYRLLSGKAAMLPKWAFGYLQSQERYETADEIVNTVKEYRERNVGLDCIILDWMSWKGDLWGEKTLDEERFPDPSMMMEKLHALNARLMISIWPAMNEDTDNYKEFADKKLLLPASNIYDAYSEQARKLYWAQAEMGLFSKGIDGWWCDSSEPITPEWARLEKPEPSTMYYEFIKECGGCIPLEKCNTYGLVHAQGIYEGQRAAGSSKRVVNLTRSGYIGQQKYGAILWSGDIYASWDTLKKQIAAGLNFCASGLPYWTLDIGGFFVKKGVPWFWAGEYDDGCADLGFRELYTRWFQYGAFLPVFRAHGTDVRREIWAFGEPGDMFYDALVNAIQLRYRLLPYIYSLAGETWYNDSTILRMLAFDFPDDEKAASIKDQFMFGKNILVCPVTSPMYYDTGSKPIDCAEHCRQVYLPFGSKWYDFWTNKVYEGGTYINAAADISQIPLFIREGSIIPMAKPMNYADELAGMPIELKVYPGKDCEFLLYDDAGDGYMYEQGDYLLTRIIWEDAQASLSYEIINSGKNANRQMPKFFQSVIR